MTESVDSILPLGTFIAYGLAGAFVLALVERIVPIVPSYGLFIFLGSTLANNAWDLVPLIIVTTLASTLSGIIWYGIGYLLGEERTHRAVVKYGKYVWLKEELYLSLSQRYERNAFIATFIGQTVPAVRVYLSLPAGILALPLGTFSLAVFLGSAIWVGGFTAIGYGLNMFGWDPVIATIIAVIALVIIEGGILLLIQRRRRRSQMQS